MKQRPATTNSDGESPLGTSGTRTTRTVLPPAVRRWWCVRPRRRDAGRARPISS